MVIRVVCATGDSVLSLISVSVVAPTNVGCAVGGTEATSVVGGDAELETWRWVVTANVDWWSVDVVSNLVGWAEGAAGSVVAVLAMLDGATRAGVDITRVDDSEDEEDEVGVDVDVDVDVEEDNDEDMDEDVEVVVDEDADVDVLMEEEEEDDELEVLDEVDVLVLDMIGGVVVGHRTQMFCPPVSTFATLAMFWLNFKFLPRPTQPSNAARQPRTLSHAGRQAGRLTGWLAGWQVGRQVGSFAAIVGQYWYRLQVAREAIFVRTRCP